MEGQRKRENWLQKVKQMNPEQNLMQCDINKAFDAIKITNFVFLCIMGIFIGGLFTISWMLEISISDRTNKQDSYL